MADRDDGSSQDKARLWLYPNKYKNADNHPGLTGNGEISRLALRKIVEVAKQFPNEEVIKLRSASWSRTSRAGNEYTYVTLEVDDKQYGKQDDKQVESREEQEEQEAELF